jgi:tRNA A-37 threonylcarbamoyl transferase component Bud32
MPCVLRAVGRLLFPSAVVIGAPFDLPSQATRHLRVREMAPPHAIVPGVPFGNYRIVRELGRGGSAVVHEARQVDSGRHVAIKIMRRRLASNEHHVARFLREARAAARVHHPHVIGVLDVGTAQGLPYIAMNLIDGEELGRKLARDGPMNVEETVDVLLPVISAIAASHDAGVIHRDLKPSNILLTRQANGRLAPMVVDFGVSKILFDSSLDVRTHSRALLGSVHYVAPEQARASRAASARSDQYSLGAILYECATGGPPFWGDDHYDLLHAVLTAPLIPLREINPDVLASFEAVVMKALSRDPDDRFASMRELGVALLPFASAQSRRAWANGFAGCAHRGPDEGRKRAAFSRRSLRMSLWLVVAGAVAFMPGTLTSEAASSRPETRRDPPTSLAPTEAPAPAERWSLAPVLPPPSDEQRATRARPERRTRITHDPPASEGDPLILEPPERNAR